MRQIPTKSLIRFRFPAICGRLEDLGFQVLIPASDPVRLDFATGNRFLKKHTRVPHVPPMVRLCRDRHQPLCD
jgi:hypothetical protein